MEVEEYAIDATTLAKPQAAKKIGVPSSHDRNLQYSAQPMKYAHGYKNIHSGQSPHHAATPWLAVEQRDSPANRTIERY